MERTKSDYFYHLAPHNYNCSQAILKGFQKEFGIEESEIEAYRANGGGRAENGVCGALYAANRLLAQLGKEDISSEFSNTAGSIICKEIKANKYPCLDCVKMADELVAKKLGLVTF